MPGGRPTKYNKGILEKANKYLEEYEAEGDMIPSVEGLALVLNVARRTIYNWADTEGNDEFLHILGLINKKQHQVLINKGLTNEFNSAIVKLVLGKHGYHEKTDNTHSGPDGGPIETSTAINFLPVCNKKP